jgi:hypothetical protein
VAGLLDGGTRSRVYWVGRGVYMGLYYANLSFVEFSTMILGITCICIHWLYGYRYTVSSFIQYVVTIAKLNLSIHNIFILVSVGTLV